MLAESKVVWARRLWADHGLRLALAPPAGGQTLHALSRALHAAAPSEPLRFQAVLVNGGIDGATPTAKAAYWADNLFRQDRSPYCSDCSTNADCLALLLDGDEPRETQYEQVRQYMRRRCRYAAALLAQVHHLEPPMQNVEELMAIVERWSDNYLEHFYTSLVSNLENVRLR